MHTEAFCPDQTVEDMVSLFVSLESIHEQLSHDEYIHLDHKSNGLLSETFGIQPNFTASMESVNAYKVGLIATTIAAIVAAVVYALRKFFKLPSIQRLRQRFTDVFRDLKNTDRLEQAFEQQVVPKAVSETVSYPSEPSETDPLFVDMRQRFVILTHRTDVADYGVRDFFAMYNTEEHLQNHMTQHKAKSVIPAMFLREDSRQELNRLRYLMKSLVQAVPKRLKSLNVIVKHLNSVPDLEAARNFHFVLGDDLLNIMNIYLIEDRHKRSADTVISSQVIEHLDQLFTYKDDNTLDEVEFRSSFKEMVNSNNQLAILDIVTESQKLGDILANDLKLIEKDLPDVIYKFSEMAQGATRMRSNEEAAIYTSIANRLQEQLYALNRIVSIAAKTTDGLEKLCANITTYNTDLVMFMQKFNEYSKHIGSR